MRFRVIASNKSCCYNLRAIVHYRVKRHGCRKHPRTWLCLHARPERCEASPSLLHALSSPMVDVGVKSGVYGIARGRSDKLHFWYTELDLLRRGRVFVGRGIVVECERPFEGRTVTVCEHQSSCHEVTNKEWQAARTTDNRDEGGRTSDSKQYEAIGPC